MLKRKNERKDKSLMKNAEAATALRIGKTMAKWKSRAEKALEEMKKEAAG